MIGGDSGTYRSLLEGANFNTRDLKCLLKKVCRRYGDRGVQCDDGVYEAIEKQGLDIEQYVADGIYKGHDGALSLIETCKFDTGQLVRFLHTATETDDLFTFDAMETIVKKGIDLDEDFLNVTGGYEFTPFVQAIINADYDVVEFLVKLGSPLNNDFREVLFHALWYNDKGRMVKLLIQYGADVNIDSDLEGTALHFAANRAVLYGDTTDLKLFLGAGARERSSNGDDWRYEGWSRKDYLTPTEYIQKTFEGDSEHCDALERVSLLLAQNEAWCRRSWLIMLRSRTLKATVDGCGEGDDRIRPRYQSAVASRRAENETKMELATMMPNILGLNEGLFCMVVSFL